MIIGLVGWIGSGKGTVADYLVSSHGFVKESFANSVKDSVSAVFGWDRQMLEGDTIQSRAWREQPDAFWSKKLNREFSPRLALQLMGTEAGRDVFHLDLWIFTFLRRMQEDKNYVLADVRFPNEIKHIKEAGGKIVWVRRGHLPEWYMTAVTQNTTDENDLWLLEDKNGLMEQKFPKVHFSEWAWIGSHIDAVIDNDGTLYALQKQVDLLLK
jgi:hypothetical protein